jgi:hypothetical protein
MSRSGLGATAGGLEAFGTALPVFVAGGGFEVNVAQACEAGKPGKDVGKFVREVLRVAVTYGAGEFADFFGEPAKCAVEAATGVFGKVGALNQGLEFSNCHVANYVDVRGEVKAESRVQNAEEEPQTNADGRRPGNEGRGQSAECRMRKRNRRRTQTDADQGTRAVGRVQKGESVGRLIRGEVVAIMGL